MNLVRAAGGLLWRPTAEGPKVVIVHRPRHGDWSLPKGKLSDGERWEAAALREVEEETGCRARIVSFAGATSRLSRGLPKVVLYWNMELIREGELDAGDEVDEVRWLGHREALRLLDADADRRLLARSPPGGAGARGGSGPSAVTVLRSELLRRGLVPSPANSAATLGPALELLDEADLVAGTGNPAELRVLLLAARWLALPAEGSPGRTRQVAALRAEARKLARRPRRKGAPPPPELPAAWEPPPDLPISPVPAEEEELVLTSAGEEEEEEEEGPGERLEASTPDPEPPPLAAPPAEAPAAPATVDPAPWRAATRAAGAALALAAAGLLVALAVPSQQAPLLVFGAAGLAGGALVALAALRSAR